MHFLRAISILFLSFCPLQAKASESPLALLSEAEMAYYQLVFNYVMETVQPDNKYTWISHSGKGTFSVSESYKSKSGSVCRNFAEILDIGGRHGDGEGVGCKREGEEGWCKLKLSDARTCSMEPNSTKAQDIVRDATESIMGTEGIVKGIQNFEGY